MRMQRAQPCDRHGCEFVKFASALETKFRTDNIVTVLLPRPPCAATVGNFPSRRGNEARAGRAGQTVGYLKRVENHEFVLAPQAERGSALARYGIRASSDETSACTLVQQRFTILPHVLLL